MAIDKDAGDNDDLDTQGLLFVMLNAIQAIAIAHPNRAAVREMLVRASEKQIEKFELGNADAALKEAYEFYSTKIIDAIPATNAPVDVDLDVDIKL